MEHDLRLRRRVAPSRLREVLIRGIFGHGYDGATACEASFFEGHTILIELPAATRRQHRATHLNLFVHVYAPRVPRGARPDHVGVVAHETVSEVGDGVLLGRLLIDLLKLRWGHPVRAASTICLIRILIVIAISILVSVSRSARGR